MMKKTALLSLYNSPNYGALLQSYALQKLLFTLGIDSVYLPYSLSYHYTPLKFILHFLGSLISVLFGSHKKKNKFSLFRKSYLTISPKSTNEEYSLYIVGSDQVWRPSLLLASNGFFFAPFANGKRIISFASSFGVKSLPDDLYPEYRKLLSNFANISVREIEGINILHNLGFSSAEIMCDPTFLLLRKDWEAISIPPCPNNKPYIFCYVMRGDISTADYIFRLAKHINNSFSNIYDIIIVGDREYRKLIPGYNLLCDVGPMEFLGLINHASFVVTSSYHGTCFSIIFEKHFINVLDRSNAFNNRILGLRKLFNLNKNLLYTDIPITDYDYIKEDFSHFVHTINSLRNKAFEYLLNNCIV